MDSQFTIKISDDISVDAIKKILAKGLPHTTFDVREDTDTTVYCYNCNIIIDPKDDEEIFYDDDGQPLCETCYADAQEKELRDIQVKIKQFCEEKGISVAQAKKILFNGQH